MNQRGILISVEGIDGAGKTTLVESLSKYLPNSVKFREPGGVSFSENVRELILNNKMEARTEALLFAAARAQLVHEMIRPQLEIKKYVILDRFTDSSIAYQGGGRELGLAEIKDLNMFATGGLEPDVTFLLQLDNKTAKSRRAGKDKFESQNEEFFNRVIDAYGTLAMTESDRIKVIDATLSEDEIMRIALEKLKSMM